MKKRTVSVILVIFIVFSFCARAEATFPTFDAVNAALNELRNALMKTQFVEDISCAIERLEQLKATYYELTRFHSGLDDFFESVIGDPLKELLRTGSVSVKDAFPDFEWLNEALELFNGTGDPQDIRRAIEDITGEIPDSTARPYIPFEEMQVVDGFNYAEEIRLAGELTREGASEIALQAKSASPKGAARLGVEAMTKIMVLSQENQEALAKLIELEATGLEQTSRDEKRYERERLRYMDEFKEGLDNLWRVR